MDCRKASCHIDVLLNSYLCLPAHSAHLNNTDLEGRRAMPAGGDGGMWGGGLWADPGEVPFQTLLIVMGRTRIEGDMGLETYILNIQMMESHLRG